MIIASVEPRHLSVPLDEPIPATASLPPIDTLELHLVRLETESGVVAWGEACADSDEVVDAAVEALAPVVLGTGVLDRGALWERMVDRLTAQKEPLPGGAAALSAVDIAIWDLAGHAVDLPVFQMLGGRRRVRMEAYASGIYHVDPETAARKAREALDRGFHALRIEAGAGHDRDLAVLAAVREAVGAETLLLVNANQSAAGRDEAMEFGGALDRHEVFWYEEPLPPGDWTDYVSLRHALNTPIAGGASLRSPGAFLQPLMRGALDVVMPDVRLCGGITGLLKTAELARWFGARVSPRNGLSPLALIASLHAAITLPNCVMTEVETTQTPVADALLEQAPPLADGFVELPDGPGLGVTVSESFVDAHLKQ